MQSTRPSKKQASSKRTNQVIVSPLSALRSYPKQPISQLSIPTSQTILASAGLVALAQPLSPQSTVVNWATRFQSLYEEYRVVRIDIRIDFFSSTNSGILLGYFDEKLPFTTPTATIASQSATARKNISSITSPMLMTWVPKDLADLDFTPTLSSDDVVALCLFTNSTFGTFVNAAIAVVSTNYLVQFRGYAN
jgi:hypothetical protein